MGIGQSMLRPQTPLTVMNTYVQTYDGITTDHWTFQLATSASAVLTIMSFLSIKQNNTVDTFDGYPLVIQYSYGKLPIYS